MQIDVAIVPVSSAPVDELWTLLDESERARAERYRFDGDRRRSIVARGMLRRMLGARLERDPRALRFVTGPHGKPALANGELEFNGSHSGDRVALAIAEGTPVGIDIEELKPRVTELSSLARRYFASDEAREVEHARPDDALRTFFSIWTAKEAVVKALGGGLSIDLSSFSVLPLTSGEHAVTHLHEWHVQPLDGGELYRAAVCVRGGGWRVVNAGY
jgi:4'-phosphopantetheinyl transferase